MSEAEQFGGDIGALEAEGAGSIHCFRRKFRVTHQLRFIEYRHWSLPGEHIHRVVVSLPSEHAVNDRSRRVLHPRHLFTHHMRLHTACRFIKKENETVGFRSGGQIVNRAFLATQSPVTQINDTVIMTLTRIAGQGRAVCVMDEAKGEVGSHFQLVPDIGENTARDQLPRKLDGVGLKVVQIGNGEHIQLVEELGTVIVAIECLRLVVIHFSRIGTCKVGVFRIVNLTRLIVRHVNIEDTRDVFNHALHLYQWIFTVHVLCTVFVFHKHDERVDIVHLDEELIIIEMRFICHKVKQTSNDASREFHVTIFPYYDFFV